MKEIRRHVLVTGGGGFIGSKLVRALLKNGCKVKVLDVQKGYLNGETQRNLEFVGVGSDSLSGGMADKQLVEQAVSDVDVIYHLAINWDGSTWRHTLPLAHLFDANVEGVINLLEEAKSKGVKHFLFASSVAVYGETESQVVDEETVCKPELWNGDPGPAYGVLKLTMEKLCLMYNHYCGLPVTVFRIDVVFSDDEELYVNRQIVDKVRKGETVEVMEGEGSASIHVDDVVQALLLATLNRKAYGHVFNLTNPRAYMSDRELYELLVRVTRSRSKIRGRKVPKKAESVMSIRKAQTVLGWKPRKTKEDREKAIARTVQMATM